MVNYDEKYAKLLVNKCFTKNREKPLVIMIGCPELEAFAELCLKKAYEVGFKDVMIFDKKSVEVRDYLIETPLDEIRRNTLLDRSKLEEYAKKEANFLYLETYMPEFWQETSIEKRVKMEEILDEQLETYYENTGNYKCPWCVACYPNMDWAKKVYPKLSSKEAYNQLHMNIIKMCLCDELYPELEWENLRNRHSEISEKLTDLRIERLRYQNSLGTDLQIYLPDNHIWIGGNDVDYYGNSFISNMPCFEIFTSPIFTETEGIVYSTKQLNLYDQVSSTFGLEFKKGRVVNILGRTEDVAILNKIFEREESARYLGECAIVEANTPVNQTNTLYYELLYDENSSPHLALGRAYQDTLKDGLAMTKEELIKNGLNVSKEHIDFMIGTPDLTIEADTKSGKQLIYKDGKFNI